MAIVSIALRMLLHRRVRAICATIGMSIAFFLTAAQLGVLVGWCNTVSAIVRKTDVDLWVMAERTAAFDYGMPIPENRVYQVRSVPGVDWAEAMMMSWVYWRRPDGRSFSIEMVGIDGDLVGGPWEMEQGDVPALLDPDAVIIDKLHLDMLGVATIGDEAEILGHRAVVRGVSRGVRTFTAAPFVFTSLRTAHRYEPYYRPDEITYVLARCADGYDAEDLKQRINSSVAGVEALTSREFARRTILFWMLETGAGITLVLTAALGLAVGALIGSQTLYAVTQENQKEYATLLAIGFSRSSMVAVVMLQSTVFSVASVLLGSLLFEYAAGQLDQSPIPLETTPLIFASTVVGYIIAMWLASLVAMRAVFRVDPLTVFHH